MFTRARNALLLLALGVALSCCSPFGKKANRDPFAGKGSPHYQGSGDVPWGGGRYHVGKPYQVAGRWFTPKEQPNYDKKGLASWYGDDFHRRKTANGEFFDMNRLTAAHATLPLPSYVKVTNLENGREAVLRVNDRGPFVDTRVIDVSKQAAKVLDFKHRGTVKVRVQYIGPAPLGDNGAHLMAMNRELERGTPMRKMIAAAAHRKGDAPQPDVVVAETKPVKKAAPPVAVEAVADASPVSGQTEVTYFVQLGSFSDGERAARVRDHFAAIWPVQFIELSGASGPIYRVRLGPISQSEDAQTALTDAQSAGFRDARLIQNQSVQASLQ